MDTKLELLLVKKYPSIFQNYGGPAAQTCMHFGMTCENGWYYLISNACKQVDKICSKYGINFVAEQIKAKFGGLRFYYELSGYEEYKIKKLERKVSKYFYKYKKGKLFNRLVDFREFFYKTPAEKIRDIVNNAERLSCTTCESCGKPGRMRGKGYVYTACDECDKETK